MTEDSSQGDYAGAQAQVRGVYSSQFTGKKTPLTEVLDLHKPRIDAAYGESKEKGEQAVRTLAVQVFTQFESRPEAKALVNADADPWKGHSSKELDSYRNRMISTALNYAGPTSTNPLENIENAMGEEVAETSPKTVTPEEIQTLRQDLGTRLARLYTQDINEKTTIIKAGESGLEDQIRTYDAQISTDPAFKDLLDRDPEAAGNEKDSYITMLRLVLSGEKTLAEGYTTMGLEFPKEVVLPETSAVATPAAHTAETEEPPLVDEEAARLLERDPAPAGPTSGPLVMLPSLDPSTPDYTVILNRKAMELQRQLHSQVEESYGSARGTPEFEQLLNEDSRLEEAVNGAVSGDRARTDLLDMVRYNLTEGAQPQSTVAPVPQTPARKGFGWGTLGISAAATGLLGFLIGYAVKPSDEDIRNQLAQSKATISVLEDKQDVTLRNLTHSNNQLGELQVQYNNAQKQIAELKGKPTVDPVKPVQPDTSALPTIGPSDLENQLLEHVYAGQMEQARGVFVSLVDSFPGYKSIAKEAGFTVAGFDAAKFAAIEETFDGMEGRTYQIFIQSLAAGNGDKRASVREARKALMVMQARGEIDKSDAQDALRMIITKLMQ